ncbi:hypothetical protein GIY62_17890 [Burkholderia plantarii]|uniref:hypothetical protein n=1 Tax=Burkholderia plantarii TaxID=41899 RepID=UPI00158B167F|nr:hypothetical protein [Burkholderia plantarii]WLE58949.1 hypothetical protein GIY62_17890 [Burkholderia plantarii]
MRDELLIVLRLSQREQRGGVDHAQCLHAAAWRRCTVARANWFAVSFERGQRDFKVGAVRHDGRRALGAARRSGRQRVKRGGPFRGRAAA